MVPLGWGKCSDVSRAAGSSWLRGTEQWAVGQPLAALSFAVLICTIAACRHCCLCWKLPGSMKAVGTASGQWVFFFILKSPNAVLYILVFLQVHLSSIFIAFIRMRRKLKTRAGASVLPSLLPEKKATQVCLAIFLCCESVSVFHHKPLPFQAPFKHSLIT